MILVNSIPVKPTIFPDGTSQIWKLPLALFETKRAVVYWEFENEAEIMHIAQIKSLMDSKGVKVNLHMGYLPYGRQDKPVSNEATFALTSFSTVLNALDFDQVEIYDPHSPIATDLIKNSIQWKPDPDIQHTITQLRPDYLCYPDKGASTKYAPRFKGTPYFCANKVRNQATGEITGLELLDAPKLDGFNVLIIDDLCDAGGTFIRLSKLLKDSGAANIWLHVSHGLFTKGTGVLTQAGISKIFTKKGELI